MTLTRINIAIKPNNDVVSQAIRLSEQVSKQADAYFVLDGKNFFPHITIYSPEYPAKNQDFVLDTIVKTTKNILSFNTAFTSFSSHLGYIDIAIEKTNDWIKLHDLVVNQLNPLRENHLREKYKQSEELANYSVEQQNYIQQFGYAEVFNAFRPHLTISRLKDEAVAKEIAASLQFPTKGFTVETVAAYTMGNHGTCTGVIKEFSIK